MNLDYIKNGDYYIPNIQLSEDNKNVNIGKYGIMRLNYLKEYKKAEYTSLLMQNKLQKHLLDVNETATKRMKLIIDQIANQEHINEYQKGKDSLDWVCAMNNAQARAEEIVLNELIYV